MDLYLMVKFLHIAAGMWLVTGIVGRSVAVGQAGKTSDIGAIRTLMQLAGRFESLMVRPASFVVLALGIAAAWAQGWPLFGFLQGAEANWLLVSLVLVLATIPLIAFVFVPRGKVFEQALQTASVQGGVTPQLKAAFNDGAVRKAHVIEGALLVIVVYLMVAKPF